MMSGLTKGPDNSSHMMSGLTKGPDNSSQRTDCTYLIELDSDAQIDKNDKIKI